MRKPISTLANPVGRCIRYEHNHLRRILLPLHIKRFRQRGRRRLGSITTSVSIESFQVSLHGGDARREPKVLRHIRIILRRVVPESDEPEPDVLGGDICRGGDLLADTFNGDTSRRDVGLLTPSGVLKEYKVSARRVLVHCISE